MCLDRKLGAIRQDNAQLGCLIRSMAKLRVRCNENRVNERPGRLFRTDRDAGATGFRVQLDAPRHLFLHTLKSMEILAAGSGFKVRDVVFDSTDFQFWASEQYQRDIPLKDKRSYALDPANSLFSPSEILRFKETARELNRNGEGDSACFYLYKHD